MNISNGVRDGAALREKILAFQGIEPEFKRDLESRISNLEHRVAHYKNYYDWYFRVYHLKYEIDDREIISILHEMVGQPDKN